MSSGPRNLITDIEGLRVGSSVDQRARTGVTVLLPEAPARAAVDVRGGGPGTRETDALALENLVDRVDAVVLSGGSVYGLAAADTVSRKLGAARKGFSLVEAPGVPVSPIVPSAILFDLANGGDKKWGETPPYARLGDEALAAAEVVFPLGAHGAGAGATAGVHPGGLGSASFITESGYTVGALVAVNAFGSPYIPGTNQFWAAPYELDGEYGGRGMSLSGPVRDLPTDTKLAGAGRENTTIAVIATDADLTAAELKRLAIMAQDGLARALRPAHGPTDGDVVFALSTGARALPDPRLAGILQLGTVAGDVLARAIARGVYMAETA